MLIIWVWGWDGDGRAGVGIHLRGMGALDCIVLEGVKCGMWSNELGMADRLVYVVSLGGGWKDI